MSTRVYCMCGMCVLKMLRLAKWLTVPIYFDGFHGTFNKEYWSWGTHTTPTTS